MSVPPLVQKLTLAPIFRGLSEEEMAPLLGVSEQTRVPAGTTVFSEGDKGDGLYFVLEGTLEVRKAGKAGAPLMLATVVEGGVLGEMSLLGETPTRSASAVAIGPVRLLKLPSDRFGELLATGQVGALKLALNLARVMSRRLWLMDEKLLELMDPSRKKEELLDFQRILGEWQL
jgi:CRP/FNR family transcriptional regulator